MNHGHVGKKKQAQRFSAVTLIHELGHAADWLFGADASKIGDDQDDYDKSKENSELVYDKCFK